MIKSRGSLCQSSNFPPAFWDNLTQPALRPATPAVHTTECARFARHGGPDLRHLRGTKSTKSIKAITVIPKKSSAYDKAFEQHFYDNNTIALTVEFSDGAFECFWDEHNYLDFEGDVMHKSITDGETVDAKPDFYDGARFGDIDKKTRKDSSHSITPTKNTRRLVVPNFFLEAKDPEGVAGVAKREAGYDGAIGARAMYALQNYGAEELAFDGNAHTSSSTCYAGTGTLQLDFDMTDSREIFIQRATAFQNARDFAQRHRDSFIQAANARACQSSVEAPLEAEITVAVTEQYEGSTADEFVDCEDHVGSQAVGAWNDIAAQDVDEGPALPEYLYEEEEPSQESTSLGAEPAMSLATSFTSSFSQSQTSSKRTRASHSPPSNSQPYKKHGSAKWTRQGAICYTTAGVD
ncbi:hypothetical protein QBC44DRAFT_342252 [Cladorrhinum sp. PSN332]|nr:hypothetical protein QBC44DRAFT_342252 [Cladorrhinum sp. PSN332]